MLFRLKTRLQDNKKGCTRAMLENADKMDRVWRGELGAQGTGLRAQGKKA